MSLQQAERFVELPHSDTEEGVNFACEVEFFYPGTCENRQVTNYPTFLLPNNTSVYPSSHSFLLLLLHFDSRNNRGSIPFVYVLLV